MVKYLLDVATITICLNSLVLRRGKFKMSEVFLLHFVLLLSSRHVNWVTKLIISKPACQE